jgi:hypothetical protein
MKKLNNKGFALVETMVVSVFIMAIFTIIYTNFYPLVGEYEKRENYDDIDSKYGAYWVKRMIQSQYYTDDNINKISPTGGLVYTRFDCDKINITGAGSATTAASRKMCEKLLDAYGVVTTHTKDKVSPIVNAYITGYGIGSGNSTGDTINKVDFKAAVAGDTTNKVFSTSFQDYVITLPNYVKASLNSINAQKVNYRVFVEFSHYSATDGVYNTYANIEVVK